MSTADIFYLGWYDNTKKTLGEKITTAAAHYQKKYGRRPNLCLVCPSDLEQHNSNSGNHLPNEIRVQPASNVQPNHLLIAYQPE